MSIKHLFVNKGLHILVFVVVLLLTVSRCVPIKCSAEETLESRLNSGVEDILDDFYDTIPDGALDAPGAEDITDALGVKRILASIIRAARGGAGEAVELLAILIGVALISVLASLYEGEVAAAVSRSIGIVGAALLLDRLLYLVEGALDTLSEVNTFFASVIPISLAINSLGASMTTASTQAMGMGLTLGAYSFLSESMLGGVVGAIFVSSALSDIDPILSRLSRTVRSVFAYSLGVTTLLFGATFAFQSTISASADSLAIRGAKYAISNTIPMVGSAVSGALGVVSGSISYAKGIVGGGAVAVILSLVLSPLVTLLMYRMCMHIGASVVSHCSLGCDGVISSFVGALDALIAVYSLTAVVYVVEIVAFMKGGVSLA